MKDEKKNDPPTPENRMVGKGQVKVRVVRQSIVEDGKYYQKGDEFTLAAKRAKELGPLVEPASE